MVFSSSIFLFGFLPILLFVYFLAAERYRNAVLLVASLAFYAWGEPRNVFLMMASIVINYLLGLAIQKFSRWRKVALILSIVFNLGMLFYFKYLNFTVGIIESVTHITLGIKSVALPIGISFFTFQIMSYVIDVYRGNVPAQRNILSLALYISLFPQLIAGPIVRYADVEKQINSRYSSWDKAYEGFRRFIIGFSKKVIIADQLSVLVDTVFNNNVGYPSIISQWVGIIAYTLQIYYDFSGYSDMAIGLGKVFGFDFLENFNYPYISRSIKEFWRRWHISLSSWFRDYLYIPLGGNRKGTARTYINLLIVFFVTGLWHGASYNFIVWGLYYGFFLVVERIGFGRVLERWPRLIQHIYALIIITIGWVFFRADSLNAAIRYIKGMFVPYGRDLVNFRYIMNTQYYTCLVVGMICAVPYARLKNIYFASKAGRILVDVATVIMFIIALCVLIGSGFSPFLYFRF